MPTITLKVAILDFGKAGKPMVIQCEDTPLTLDLPAKPTGSDRRCADYATYAVDAPPILRPGPKSVHLGFYGYLRVANAMCIQKCGMSIFGLGDARWHDAYDDHRPPLEMVEEVLAEEGFPSDDE